MKVVYGYITRLQYYCIKGHLNCVSMRVIRSDMHVLKDKLTSLIYELRITLQKHVTYYFMRNTSKTNNYTNSDLTI